MDPPSPADRSDFECAQYFRRLMDDIPEFGKTPLWAACLLMGESRLGSKPTCKIENNIRAKRCCTSSCAKAVLYVHRGTPINRLGTSNGSGTPDEKNGKLTVQIDDLQQPPQQQQRGLADDSGVRVTTPNRIIRTVCTLSFYRSDPYNSGYGGTAQGARSRSRAS